MSRRPGLGTLWLKKFKTDVWPDDFIVIDDKKFRPPRFYDGHMELEDADYFRKLKASRVRKAKLHAANNTVDRRRVREKVLKSKLAMLPRKV